MNENIFLLPKKIEKNYRSCINFSVFNGAENITVSILSIMNINLNLKCVLKYCIKLKL